jgi:hypothetical protein
MSGSHRIPGAADWEDVEDTLLGLVVGLGLLGVIVLVVLWLSGFGFAYMADGPVECRERTLVFHQLQCHEKSDPTSVWTDRDALPAVFNAAKGSIRSN